MKSIQDVLDLCDAELRRDIIRIWNGFHESWHDDLFRIFVAALDQGAFADAFFEIEHHWDSYLQYRPEPDRVKPAMPDLLHPTHRLIRNIERRLGL